MNILELKPQTQPNIWSCLPTAFAMAADMPVDALIKRIGHDGSRLLAIASNENFRQKLEDNGTVLQIGFHPQEILWRLFEEYNIVEHSEAYILDEIVESIPTMAYRFKIAGAMAHAVYAYNDPATQKGHAYAWDAKRKLFIDPKNGDTLDAVEFDPTIFWTVERKVF